MPKGFHVEQRPDGLFTLYRLQPVMDALRPEQIVHALALAGSELGANQTAAINNVLGVNGGGAHSIAPPPAQTAAPAAQVTTAQRLQQEEMESLLGEGADIEGTTIRTTDPRLFMIAFRRGPSPNWSLARAQQWVSEVFKRNRKGGALKLDRAPYQIRSPRPGVTEKALSEWWFFSVRPESQFKPDTTRVVPLSNGIELLVADPKMAKYASLSARQLASA